MAGSLPIGRLSRAEAEPIRRCMVPASGGTGHERRTANPNEASHVAANMKAARKALPPGFRENEVNPHKSSPVGAPGDGDSHGQASTRPKGHWLRPPVFGQVGS